MIRILLGLIGILAAAWLFVRVWREMAGSNVDWTGVAFVAGFVALAFYLSHTTEIGGVG
jgi:hypothetical protein